MSHAGQRGTVDAEWLVWHGGDVRAADTFRGLDVVVREGDTAERVVRRFFEGCEAARRSGRTERLLRRMARSALGGARRWRVLNALVSSRFSMLVGIDGRAQRVQLVSAHLLGIAYARYVFGVEPLASLPVERIIALSVPVVQHYLADSPQVDQPAVESSAGG